MALATEQVAAKTPLTKEERMVIVASSVGTVFEWYDFYLYATLAPFFATLFFPKGNDTAALLSAFAAYAAGFLVRPFGALVFGRIGDLIGRKYTFLVTIVVMGLSTFGVGLLPTFATIGWWAPIIMVTLRLLQGLALGGEYGGAATYVAEHSAPNRRGYNTSWIQTTATVGFFLCLGIILGCRTAMTKEAFATWGWRIPFWMSIFLLGVSVWIRLKLHESPVFTKMKAEGKGSKAPLTDSFLKYPNNKYALLALLGATAGQGVVWYTGQFYALFFLQITLKLDFKTTYMLIGASLLLGTPFFIFFGWLSDKIGRLKIILFGCLIAALTFFPMFKALTHYVNPALETFQYSTQITVAGDPKDETFNLFVGPWSKFSELDRVNDFFGKQGLNFTKVAPEPGKMVVATLTGKNPTTGQIVTTRVEGWSSASEATLKKTLTELGYPKEADPSKVNYPMTLLILFVFLIYVTMVYGPIAAFLVELFPTNIRYTSMSLPYHIGNGWFGGMLPLIATAIVALKGNIYYGLWYPVIVALMTVVIGFLFLKETKDRDISTYQH
ncbi:MAG: MHS family MFS transporter [Holophagaceae bacterium]|uniref:MHS family MFS transporter n=1 Tax=Candidatus Geothrix odensensis TaxID=2954440 RepID=A0A936F0A4_9BACT|nr:MHS family MFS transporter [Candidatus Geothrix odensensis]